MKKYNLILVTMFFVCVSYGQKQNTHIIAGNKLYKEEKFDKALLEYMKALEVDAGNAVANYNLGNTYFRGKRYEEAAKTFDNTIATDSSGTMRQNGFYNKGVSLSKQNVPSSVAEWPSSTSPPS